MPPATNAIFVLCSSLDNARVDFFFFMKLKGAYRVQSTSAPQHFVSKDNFFFLFFSRATKKRRESN